jgi:hypothetical protein
MELGWGNEREEEDYFRKQACRGGCAGGFQKTRNLPKSVNQPPFVFMGILSRNVCYMPRGL